MRRLVGEGSLHDRVHGMVLGLACAEAIGLPFTGQTHVHHRDVEDWAADTRPLTWSSSTVMLRAMITHLGSAESAPRIREHALGEDLATAWARAPWRGFAAEEIRTLRHLHTGRPAHCVTETVGGPGDCPGFG